MAGHPNLLLGSTTQITATTSSSATVGNENSTESTGFGRFVEERVLFPEASAKWPKFALR